MINRKVLKKSRGSEIVTIPIIIAIGIMIISILIVLSVKILMPYIWYEKLSSTCIKYVFVMEEYGYLTSYEYQDLKDELRRQGFNIDNLEVVYTARKVDYGEPIMLKLSYEYDVDLPVTGKQTIDMVVERNSVSKR